MRAVALVLVTACGGGHHHGPAAHPEDSRHLYVEIAAEGSHRRALRAGAATGLSKVGFAVPSDRGGDLELQVEVSKLDVSGNQMVCRVKILAFRLPQHDLLSIADGTARAGADATDDCVEGVAAALVTGKVRAVLTQQLAAKR